MGCIKLDKIQELVWNVNLSENNLKTDAFEYLINSKVDNKREIELVLEKIDFNYHKNFIIFGVRNLSLISEIYKRKTPFSTMVIIEIVDTDTRSLYLEGEENQLAFLADKRTSLIIGAEHQIGGQLDIAFKDMLKLYNLRNIDILTMPYVKSMYPKELNNILEKVFEKLRTSIVSFGNSIEDILVGMDNYINNWEHIFRGLDCKCFEDKYKGKPAIIVGAGPSLDKNVDILNEARGKALILSVDGAMNTLVDKGIIPDVVSSIERVGLTANFYRNKDIPNNITYVGPNVVLGNILEKFNRIIFTGRTGDELFYKFNESIGFTNLNVGANVSHVLISFSRFLGCSPIIFIGLDLAYTNGKTHTEKFFDDFDKEFMDSYKTDTVYVRGQNGELLESFEHFMHTKSWIESWIAKDKEGVYINATEGGANIEGATNLKLIDVVSAYCLNEVTKLYSIYDDAKKEQKYDKKKLTDKALEFFGELSRYYENLVKESQAYYDKLLGSKKSGRVEFMEKQRLSMDRIIDQNLAGRFIVQSITIRYTRDIHSLPMKLGKEDEKKMYEINLKYYKTLKEVSKKIIENVDLYKKVLESHLNMIGKQEV